MKKIHVPKNLNKYLGGLRRKGAGEIVEDIMGGFDKLRFGGLSEFALKHFKDATKKERVSN